MSATRPLDSLIVLIPIYNDWEAVGTLIPKIDSQINGQIKKVSIVLINDGSEDRLATDDSSLYNSYNSISQIEVVHLKRNVGHQRAIAVGLAFVRNHYQEAGAIVVMDGDGQDSPLDLPRLVTDHCSHTEDAIVFAKRGRRSESHLFKTLNWIFRLIHRLLTGRSVKVGNFSLIPFSLLERLVTLPELWSHVSATAFKYDLPVRYVEADRLARIVEQSQMALDSLILHGIKAFSVYYDRIAVRSLAGLGLASVVCVFLLTFLGLISLYADTDFLTGIATLTFIFILFLLNAGAVVFFSLINKLHHDNQRLSWPDRDYDNFIKMVETVNGNHDVD